MWLMGIKARVGVVFMGNVLGIKLVGKDEKFNIVVKLPIITFSQGQYGRLIGWVSTKIAGRQVRMFLFQSSVVV